MTGARIGGGGVGVAARTTCSGIPCGGRHFLVGLPYCVAASWPYTTGSTLGGQPASTLRVQRGHQTIEVIAHPLYGFVKVAGPGAGCEASGFVRRSEVFAGDVREHKTLEEMLEALEAPAGTLVVMDRGVATEGAIGWLRDNGYRYLVVSRKRHRRFDPDTAVAIRTRSEKTLRLYKEVISERDEVRLRCLS